MERYAWVYSQETGTWQRHDLETDTLEAVADPKVSEYTANKKRSGLAQFWHVVSGEQGRERQRVAEIRAQREQREREARAGQAVRTYWSMKAFQRDLPRLAEAGWHVEPQSTGTQPQQVKIRRGQYQTRWVPTLTVTYARNEPREIWVIHEEAAARLVTCGWCKAQVPLAASCEHCCAPLKASG